MSERMDMCDICLKDLNVFNEEHYVLIDELTNIVHLYCKECGDRVIKYTDTLSESYYTPDGEVWDGT